MTDTSADWIPRITTFYENSYLPYMQSRHYPPIALMDIVLWYKIIEQNLEDKTVIKEPVPDELIIPDAPDD